MNWQINPSVFLRVPQTALKQLLHVTVTHSGSARRLV